MGGLSGELPRLVVAVQETAVNGKVNNAVIRVLAAAFDIKELRLQIVFGNLGRDKRVLVEGDEVELMRCCQELRGDLELF